MVEAVDKGGSADDEAPSMPAKMDRDGSRPEGEAERRRLPSSLSGGPVGEARWSRNRWIEDFMSAAMAGWLESRPEA
jgi:hypothetical protein